MGGSESLPYGFQFPGIFRLGNLDAFEHTNTLGVLQFETSFNYDSGSIEVTGLSDVVNEQRTQGRNLDHLHIQQEHYASWALLLRTRSNVPNGVM